MGKLTAAGKAVLAVAALGAAGGLYLATTADVPAPVSIRSIAAPVHRGAAGGASGQAAGVPAAGTLWHLAGTASIPRRPVSPIARATNYSEGPWGVIHGNGTMSIGGNYGGCCDVPAPWGAGFEGVAHLLLPAGQWEWLWTGNNAGANPELDEHESGYGSWVTASLWFTRTHWSAHDQDPFHRIGIGKASGDWGTTPWTRTDALFEPGVIEWMVAAVKSGSDTWVYVREQTETTHRCVRRAVAADGALGPAQPTTWEGYSAGQSPAITDVAIVGAEWRALESVGNGTGAPWTWDTITEWRSVAEIGPMGPIPPGVIWYPSGRHITSTLRAIWDGGYIRTETGAIASTAILMLCGDGQWADKGTWEVCVWQPTGATIPPALVPLLVQVTEPVATPTPVATATPGPSPTPGGPPTPAPTVTPTVGPPSPTPTRAPATPGVLRFLVSEDQVNGEQVMVRFVASPDPTDSPAWIDLDDGRRLACVSGGGTCRIAGISPAGYVGRYTTTLTVHNADWCQVVRTGIEVQTIAPVEAW